MAVVNGNIDQDNLKDGGVTNAKLAGGIDVTKLAANVGAGWTPGLAVPNSVTYNGNRSYSLVFNATDLTPTLSNGMRLKLTRTVTAPTQCTSLNGTTQFYSKTSPAGMTFTDDFTVSAWVKLSAYSASGQLIASRYNGTSGWGLFIASTGQVTLRGVNGGAANTSDVISYQSIPINKWVHIQANLDMSAFSTNTDGSATGSCIAIDGVGVPTSVVRAGTNPTALIQAGNLEIGSWNGGLLPFGGKIAQVAIFSSKITVATMQSYISQGLAGTETSLISAYSFNNSINDLNANANNLTANGSAVATNVDSPFAGGANASTAYTAGTTEFGEVFNISFSTNTTVVVQVPDGYAIPTTGGVSAVSYSTQSSPLGWPLPGGIKEIGYTLLNTSFTTASTTQVQILGLSSTVYIPAGRKVKVSVFVSDVFGSVSNSQLGVGIWDGTVPSGTLLAKSIYLSASGTIGSASPIATGYPSAFGSRTYNAGFSSSNANTATFDASATTPAFLLVELL